MRIIFCQHIAIIQSKNRCARRTLPDVKYAYPNYRLNVAVTGGALQSAASDRQIPKPNIFAVHEVPMRRNTLHPTLRLSLRDTACCVHSKKTKRRHASSRRRFYVPTRVTHEHGIRLTGGMLFRTTTLSPMFCGFLRQRNVSGRRFWLT